MLLQTLEADASQRDRLEETLKKELKKLQREREKVKSWAAKGEVRDKEPLLDARAVRGAGKCTAPPPSRHRL